MSRYLRGYRRKNYVGAHRTLRFPPMSDPWGSAPLFPAHYDLHFSTAGRR